MLFGNLLIGALVIGIAPTCQEITFQSLLKEMTNREAFTRFDDSFTVKQESSYDRRSVSIDAPGWYENADWGGLVRIEENDGRQEKVLFDQKGPGAVTRFWTTTGDKRGTMRFYFDGEEQASVVIDGFDVTKFPLELNRGLAVKHPLYNEDPAATGGTTLFLPIPYGKSLKITFEEPDPARFVHRYYHINYRTYESGTSVRSFSLEEARLSQLLIEQTQKELLEPSEYVGGEVSSKCGLLKPGESLELTLNRGSAAIRNLKIHSDLPEQIVVQAEFDGESCIDVPMADLGGAGYKCCRMDAWWAGCDGNGTVVSRYVMPYRKNAVIRLVNTGAEPARVCADITTSKYKWTDASMHFHAKYTQRLGLTEYNDYSAADEFVMADLKGRGVYMGDVLSVCNYTEAWWGEGDEKIWVDDDSFPSHFGTGTEDYYNASWGIDPFCSPFGGCAYREDRDGHPWTGWTSMTRTRSLDAIPFTSRLLFHMEQESAFPGTADFNTTIYWYE